MAFSGASRPQPHPGPLAVLLDEDDAGGFEGGVWGDDGALLQLASRLESRNGVGRHLSPLCELANAEPEPVCTEPGSNRFLVGLVIYLPELLAYFLPSQTVLGSIIFLLWRGLLLSYFVRLRVQYAY